jgi:hypothetical protein
MERLEWTLTSRLIKIMKIGDVNMLTVMQGAASWVQILFERSQVA